MGAVSFEHAVGRVVPDHGVVEESDTGKVVARNEVAAAPDAVGGAGGGGLHDAGLALVLRLKVIRIYEIW